MEEEVEKEEEEEGKEKGKRRRKRRRERRRGGKGEGKEEEEEEEEGKEPSYANSHSIVEETPFMTNNSCCHVPWWSSHFCRQSLLLQLLKFWNDHQIYRPSKTMTAILIDKYLNTIP